MIYIVDTIRRAAWNVLEHPTVKQVGQGDDGGDQLFAGDYTFAHISDLKPSLDQSWFLDGDPIKKIRASIIAAAKLDAAPNLVLYSADQLNDGQVSEIKDQVERNFGVPRIRIAVVKDAVSRPGDPEQLKNVLKVYGPTQQVLSQKSSPPGDPDLRLQAIKETKIARLALRLVCEAWQFTRKNNPENFEGVRIYGPKGAVDWFKPFSKTPPAAPKEPADKSEKEKKRFEKETKRLDDELSKIAELMGDAETEAKALFKAVIAPTGDNIKDAVAGFLKTFNNEASAANR